jgi:PRC-barrel domain
MTAFNPARLLGTVAVLATLPLLTATAQTQPPASSDTPPPAVTKPETTIPPAQRQVAPPMSASEKTAAAPAMPSVGLAVLTSDGSKLGPVRGVKAGSDGKVSAIYLKTGGFLGLGGKVVAIPSGKFTRSGDTVQLSMSADEVSRLPEATEAK